MTDDSTHGATQALSLLFVSGVSTGGAPRSTIDLAHALVRLGHRVRVLLGDPAARNSPMDLGVRAWVKTGRTSLLAHAIRRSLRRIGTTARPDDRSTDDVVVSIASSPENAYLGLLDDTVDAVVVNSMARAPFRWMSDDLRERHIPLVLYLREERAVGHVTESGVVPDLLVANAPEYVSELADAGVACEYIPSAIDVTAAATNSTRRAAVMVNPVTMNRPEVMIRLAERRPDVPCVLQLSWALDEAEGFDLRAAAARLPNLEIRSPVPRPADVYRDARLLVVPYPTRRPRVVAEAQYNGIPVLAADQPSLADAVGPGGRLVPVDASADTWAAEFGALWDDEGEYARVAELAGQHARRPEVDPAAVAARFAAAISAVTAQ